VFNDRTRLKVSLSLDIGRAPLGEVNRRLAEATADGMLRNGSIRRVNLARPFELEYYVKYTLDFVDWARRTPAERLADWEHRSMVGDHVRLHLNEVSEFLRTLAVAP